MEEVFLDSGLVFSRQGRGAGGRGHFHHLCTGGLGDRGSRQTVAGVLQDTADCTLLY